MLWPRTAACACLLFLAGAAAAQTPSRTRDCYRGRPLPPCRSFWITEFGLLGRLNALPEPRTTVDPFFRWEVGGMQNRNERTAFGATIVIEADDLGSRYGITPRYRRWLAARDTPRPSARRLPSRARLGRGSYGQRGSGGGGDHPVRPASSRPLVARGGLPGGGPAHRVGGVGDPALRARALAPAPARARRRPAPSPP